MSADEDKNRGAISIGDDVELLTEQIEALKELALEDDLADDAIYDFSIRWGAALAGRLPRLVHYSGLGQLAETDERRFQSLCEELRALSDLIDRFNLSQPRFTAAPATKKRRATQLLEFIRRR